MPPVFVRLTIYAASKSHDHAESKARLTLARMLTGPTAEMVAQTINFLTGSEDGLTKNEILANPEALDVSTWNAPPLWLRVQLERDSLRETDVYRLRNLMSEGFRGLLLDPKFNWAVQKSEVSRFAVEVTFLDGCGHMRSLSGGDPSSSWGDKCESDRTTDLIALLKG